MQSAFQRPNPAIEKIFAQAANPKKDIPLKVGQYGHEELKADCLRRDTQGQDVRLTLDRRMLRICNHLIRKDDFFVPPSLLRDSATDARRDYCAHAWYKVLIK